MTKTKTKRKLKLKLKLKMKWNSIGIRYKKPLEEKSHRLWLKTQNQKTRLKAPQRVAKKNFVGPTYDTSISHMDPIIFNCHHIVKFSE